MPPGGFWFFLIGVVPVAGLTWVWLRRDRAQIESAPGVFATTVSMKLRSARPWYRFGYPSALVTGRTVRLVVGKETIAIRTPIGPRWVGVVNAEDFTFAAASCETELRRGGGRFSVPFLSDDSLVLRGTDSRGRVKLVLRRPRGTTLEQVERKMIRAGAHPTVGQSEG